MHLLKEVIYTYERIHHLLKLNFFKKRRNTTSRGVFAKTQRANFDSKSKLPSKILCCKVVLRFELTWEGLRAQKHPRLLLIHLFAHKRRIATCRHNTGAINNLRPPCRPRRDTWISRCGLHVVEGRRHCLWPRYVARSDTSAVRGRHDLNRIASFAKHCH